VIASALLALRVSILGLVFLIAGNATILRRVIFDFQAWFLTFQGMQWTAGMILLQYNALANPWTPVDVYLVVLPALSVVELILADSLCLFHHRALALNSLPTTVLFVCFFGASAFRWSDGVFNYGNYSVKLFTFDNLHPIIISPRTMVAGAVFTMCVYCFKILYQYLRSGPDCTIMTLCTVLYEIETRTGNLRDKGKGASSNPLDPRKVHPAPTITSGGSAEEEDAQRGCAPAASATPIMTQSLNAGSRSQDAAAMEATASREPESQIRIGLGGSACTSLVPRNIGFSLKPNIKDTLVYYLLPAKAAAALLGFNRRFRWTIQLILIMMNVCTIVLNSLTLCGVEFAGQPIALIVGSMGISVPTLYNLILFSRGQVLGRLMSNFSTCFLIAIKILEMISIWFSIPSFDTAMSIKKGFLITMSGVGMIFFIVCDSMTISKSSWLWTSLSTAIVGLILVVNAMLGIGLWGKADDKVVQEQLGWLGNYW
jgi:hypothetical protein